MNFQAALTAMQAGQRVRRASWSAVHYMCLDDGIFIGYPRGDHGLVIILRHVDLLATDWELVP